MTDDDIRRSLTRLAGDAETVGITERVLARSRQRQRRLMVGGAVAALALVVGTVGALALAGDDDQAVIADSSTTTTADSTTTTGEPTTTTTTDPSTSTTDAAQHPVDVTTPIEHGHVGVIALGMSLYEIRDVTGQTIALGDAVGDFGGRCYFVGIEGVTGIRLWVEQPASESFDDPDFDPMAATVWAIQLEAPAWRTAKGIHPESTDADLRAAYPDATVEGHPYVANGSNTYDIDAGGQRIGFNVYDGIVHDIWAGPIPAEGCA